MIDLSYVRGRAHDYTMKAETTADPFWQFYFRMAAAYWQTAANEITEERGNETKRETSNHRSGSRAMRQV